MLALGPSTSHRITALLVEPTSTPHLLTVPTYVSAAKVLLVGVKVQTAAFFEPIMKPVPPPIVQSSMPSSTPPRWAAANGVATGKVEMANAASAAARLVRFMTFSRNSKQSQINGQSERMFRPPHAKQAFVGHPRMP